MGAVNERTVRRPNAPAPVDLAGPRPLVLGTHRCGDKRISRVLRPDGSMFTVTVPSRGMEDRPGGDDTTGRSRRRWISGGRSEPSVDGLDRLASAVGIPWARAWPSGA